MSIIGPESTSTGPESSSEGPESGLAQVARGSFMGFTFPGSGISTTDATLCAAIPVGWARCGNPEIHDSSITSGSLNSGFLNQVDSQCQRAHDAGMGFLFSMLGVPTS